MIQNLSDKVLLEKIKKLNLLHEFFASPLTLPPDFTVESYDMLKTMLQEIVPEAKKNINTLKDNFRTLIRNQEHLTPLSDTGHLFLREQTQTILEKQFLTHSADIIEGKHQLKEKTILQNLDFKHFRSEIRSKVLEFSNRINEVFGNQQKKKHKHMLECIKIIDKILSLYGYLRADQAILAQRCEIPNFHLLDLAQRLHIDPMSQSLVLNQEVFDAMTKEKMVPNAKNYFEMAAQLETQIQILHKICLEEPGDKIHEYCQEFLMKQCLIRQTPMFIQTFRQKIREAVKAQNTDMLKVQKEMLANIGSKLTTLGKKIYPFLDRSKLLQIDLGFYRNLPQNNQNKKTIVNIMDDTLQVFDFIEQIRQIKQEQENLLIKMTRSVHDDTLSFFRNISLHFKRDIHQISIEQKIHQLFKELDSLLTEELLHKSQQQDEETEDIDIKIENQLQNTENNPYLRSLQEQLHPGREEERKHSPSASQRDSMRNSMRDSQRSQKRSSLHEKKPSLQDKRHQYHHPRPHFVDNLDHLRQDEINQRAPMSHHNYQPHLHPQNLQFIPPQQHHQMRQPQSHYQHQQSYQQHENPQNHLYQHLPGFQPYQKPFGQNYH